MASSLDTRPLNDAEDGSMKYSIRRLEISIKRFIKVLSIDLDRLKKHRLNLKALSNAEDWQGLHREQVNATRTVQQVKSNIQEIEKVRKQVCDDDQQKFDDRVSEVKAKAVLALEEFLTLLNGEEEYFHNDWDGPAHLGGKADDFKPSSLSNPHFSPPLMSATSSSSSAAVIRPSNQSMSQSVYGPQRRRPSWETNPMTESNLPCDNMSSSVMADNGPSSLQPQMLMSLQAAPQNSEAHHSWEQLRENIEDLNQVIHVFAEKVHEQQEAINRIEDNIESAHLNVSQGTDNLAKASKYKAALFPTMGAVIGGTLGGPVGLLAGIKLGGIAMGLGGIMGYASGRYMKKRHGKIVEMEMARMSYNLPDPDLQHDLSAEKEGSAALAGVVQNLSSASSSSSSNSPAEHGSSTTTRRTETEPIEGETPKWTTYRAALKGWLRPQRKSCD